jgi:hypothetical protein
MDDVVGLFREKAFDERWREILRLICGLVDESKAGTFIQAILRIDTDKTVERAALAAECLAETKKITVIADAARDVLKSILSLWSSPSSAVEEGLAWARELGYISRVLPALRVLQGRWPGAEEFRDWVGARGRALMGIGLLDAFLAAVTAALVWRANGTFGPLLDRLLESDAAADRCIALASRGELFANAETKALLRERARDDPQPDVRFMALHELAQRYGDDAETEALLRARALDDPHELPRRAAFSSLARFLPELHQKVLAEDLGLGSLSIDPLMPIDCARIDATAAALHMKRAKAVALYRKIFSEFGWPIQFADDVPEVHDPTAESRPSG